MGETSRLHVHTDVDENEAWRVVATAPATSRLKSNFNYCRLSDCQRHAGPCHCLKALGGRLDFITAHRHRGHTKATAIIRGGGAFQTSLFISSCCNRARDQSAIAISYVSLDYRVSRARLRRSVECQREVE